LNALNKDARKNSLTATGESYCSRLFQLETTFADLKPEERYTKRLELSNNWAERSIKPCVMDRKNWFFANTPAGAQSSAVIYSLIETAKENGLNPYRYLLWALKTAPALAQTDEDWAIKLISACAPDLCKTS
jgi:hypothetical protein